MESWMELAPNAKPEATRTGGAFEGRREPPKRVLVVLTQASRDLRGWCEVFVSEGVRARIIQVKEGYTQEQIDRAAGYYFSQVHWPVLLKTADAVECPACVDWKKRFERTRDDLIATRRQLSEARRLLKAANRPAKDAAEKEQQATET